MIKICEGIKPDFNIDVKTDKFIYVAPNKERAAEIAKSFSTRRHKMRAVKKKLFFYDIVAGRSSVTYEEGFFDLCRHHFELINDAGYTLYWESPSNMIWSYGIKPDDESDMFALKKAYFDDSKNLVWVFNPDNYRMGRWEKEVTYGAEDCLFLRDHKLYNMFIPQMLISFKQVEIFTPCFEYSSIKIMLDYYAIGYKKIKSRCKRPDDNICFVKDIKQADIVMPPLSANVSEMSRHIAELKGFVLDGSKQAKYECIDYFRVRYPSFKGRHIWVYADKQVESVIKEWLCAGMGAEENNYD